jgi:BirA family transcriptional regulator, biotin operon repressor / biotin---[acetyl-CoA-carboxylase] ligase
VRLITEAPVRHHATLDSTNVEARRLFEVGERGPLWILADEQTAGKGRLDRHWASAPGNCYSTLLFQLTEPATVPQVGFVVALAVHTVISKFAPHITVQLKWPNDVLVDGAKISGILSEVISPSPLTLAIGCGVNIVHAPTGLPYPATCLAALGSNASRDDVFAAYRTSLARWLDIWGMGAGFTTIRHEWASRAIGIGENVVMHSGTEALHGRFQGLSDDGAIILKPVNAASRIFHAGDLRIPSLEKHRTLNA